MNVDIFCCTYAKDAEWLRFMLRSVAKYAKGFRHTVVVYPSKDFAVINPVCSSFPFVRSFVFEEAADGHLPQNIIKTSADKYSDADFILHMDSDCVFTDPATPKDYMTDGRPDLIYTHYSELNHGHAGGPVPWQLITERSLGIPCPCETMRRFPFLYPRWLYADTRARISAVNGMTFEGYVFTATNIGGAFHGYSEFNSLGCNAKERHADKFFLYDSAHGGLKPSKVKQYWSHSGLTPREREELEGVVK